MQTHSIDLWVNSKRVDVGGSAPLHTPKGRLGAVPWRSLPFKKAIDDQTYYLCTYVDNCYLGFPPGSKERENTVKALASHYELTDLGEVCYSIGARIVQSPRLKQVSLHQKPMIENIIEDYKEYIVEPKRKSYRSIPYDPDDVITRSAPEDPSLKQ